MSLLRWSVAAVLLLAISPKTQPSPSFSFVEVSTSAGLNFEHVSGSATKDYILEAQGAGLAWIDFNRDGWSDLYLVNGGRWQDLAAGKRSVANALFQNNQDGTFTNVTNKAGVAGKYWSMGVAVADFDNDGWPDLFVTNYGPNELYRNNGDGTFTDLAPRLGIDDTRWSSSAAFADFDRDGRVDLYVTNYVEFDSKHPPAPTCQYRGIAVHCGPKGMTAAGHALYRNEGAGFRDVSKASGVADVTASFGQGAVWGDYDNDGDVDLYVANDSMANFLFQNQGDGRFNDVAALAGAAYSEDGRAQASMGVDWGDYDRDGWLDIFVTNFSDDYDTLYRNLGNGLFRDVSYASGVAGPSWQYLGWGAEFADFDNDGWKDVFVANGHIYPQMDQYQIGTRFLQRPQLFLNLGNSKFREIGTSLGTSMAKPTGGRGMAVADFDNDGDLDIAVNNLDGRPSLLRNDGGNRAGRWIQFQLEGTRSNRLAAGARVTLRYGGATQFAEVKLGSSYQSCSDPRLHFGLSNAELVDSVEVRWPGGQLQRFDKVRTNQSWKLREGQALEKAR